MFPILRPPIWTLASKFTSGKVAGNVRSAIVVCLVWITSLILLRIVRVSLNLLKGVHGLWTGVFRIVDKL